MANPKHLARAVGSQKGGSIAMFVEFAEKIRRLSPEGPTEDELQNFLLEDDGKIRMYYAPFDWINTAARVAIVGITPGKHSTVNALRGAASALREGETVDESSKRGKRMGSFSNMRFAIAEMFDDLGLPDVLGIRRSEDLFEAQYDLLHPTSCIRCPVLVWSEKKQKWVNYTGHAPKLLKWDTSVGYIERVLAAELRQIPRALIVPCGEAVDGALLHLVEKNMIEDSRCLFGFPHASGANGHRKKFFNERRNQLRQKVVDWNLRY
jgi:hypothetical protein